MSATSELSCRELVELVTGYLEGSLPEAERAGIDEHLADCPGCDRAMAQFRETIRLTGTLGEDEVAAPAREDLRALFRSWKAGSAPPHAGG